MSIYISNDLYLAEIAAGGVRNRPLIGWHSVFDQSSVTSSDTSPSALFPAGSVWSPDTYTYWETDVTGPSSDTKALEFAKDATGAVNYVALFGHNLNSASIPYKLQSSNDGSSWSDVTAYKIPANDYPIIDYFDDVTAAFFRLAFNVPGLNPGVRLAHVKIGRILRLERPRYVGDIPGGMDLHVEKIGSKSYSGQHLGSVVISEGDAFNITQENNRPEFVRSNELQYFLRHAINLEKLSNGPPETFFYAWRPDDYPTEVQYCGQTTSFNPPTNQSPNGDMQWSMQGDAFKRKYF